LTADGFTFKERCDIITPKARMEKRAHIFVSGRVQGVFFRDHTQRWASSLGLSGWVRNLYDSRVEVVVEGEKEKIEGLIAKLKQGPPMADVTDVEVTWQESKGEFEGFRITW
jgi:acylphosphatase